MEVIYHKATENQRDKQIYSVKNQVVCHLFNAIKLQRFYDIAIPVSGRVLTHGDSACPFNEERVANKSLYFDAVALTRAVGEMVGSVGVNGVYGTWGGRMARAFFLCFNPYIKLWRLYKDVIVN